MQTQLQRAVRVWAVVGAIMVLAACGSSGRSTRLGGGDLHEVVQRMRHSLAQSDFLAGRNRSSEPMVIVINRVENLTSDILTTSEQWMLVARLSSALPVQSLMRQKNISLQISPERAAKLKEAGFESIGQHADDPTHVMWARFRSVSRASRDQALGATDRRAEYYYLEYGISRIGERRIEWTDSFEFKREAAGLTID